MAVANIITFRSRCGYLNQIKRLPTNTSCKNTSHCPFTTVWIRSHQWCCRWLVTHLKRRPSEPLELRRPGRSSRHQNTAHHLQTQIQRLNGVTTVMLFTQLWTGVSSRLWTLTSQYGCNYSWQEASSIDRHIENWEEFLPLAHLEVINKIIRGFFFSFLWNTVFYELKVKIKISEDFWNIISPTSPTF